MPRIDQMTDEQIIMRHAREFARLIGADEALTLTARPICGKGNLMTVPQNRRQRIPKEVEARAAAIRIGLGIGLYPRAIASLFACHPSEVVRPQPIPLTRQIERKGDLRRRDWNGAYFRGENRVTPDIALAQSRRANGQFTGDVRR